MKKVMLLTAVLTAGLITMAYAADIEVNNKLCPVSHEEVGKDGMTPHKVSYNGKTYRLCCAMCEKDFKKDPAKYAAIMDAEVAADAAVPSAKM